MATGKMTAEEYTAWCIALSKEITERCDRLIAEMRKRGDAARALDVAEAITYIESAVSD